MRWMMYRWWCEGDRACLLLWVINSVFLRSPDKEFWACPGDLPWGMPRRPETWVSLYNLMLKLCGTSRSSAILGSNSPQSNNRKGNSIHSPWETYCLHTPLLVILGYHCLHQRMHWCGCCIGSAVERRSQSTPLAIRPKIMARYEEAAAALGWLL